MKIMQAKKKIIRAALGLFMASVTLVLSVCYAWFMSGNQNKVSPVELGVQGDQSMKFGAEVIAERHYLTGAILKNTYANTKGTLVLKTSEYQKAEEEDESVVSPVQNKGASFLFDNMLPMEYVDITFSVYIQDKGMKNSDYEICLCGFGWGKENKFTLGEGADAVDYNILGVYQYWIVKDLKPDEKPDMKWLYEYKKYKPGTSDNEPPDYVSVYDNTWTAENVGADHAVQITLRIQEDFTQYYQLVSASGVPFDKYLSEKKLSIGRIVLREKAAATA